MKQSRLRLVERGNRFEGLAPEDITEPEAESLVDLALQVLAARNRKGQAIGSPTETRAYLRLRLAERPSEVFACLYLDTRHRVIALEELFQGTIDGASVHPREVVRRALECRAGAVILTHNHPSGVAEPSQADLRITQRLRDALSLVDVRVLDHVIVAAEGASRSRSWGCSEAVTASRSRRPRLRRRCHAPPAQPEGPSQGASETPTERPGPSDRSLSPSASA